MRRAVAGLVAFGLGATAITAAAPAEGKGKTYAYDVPVQARSPWPEMRRDSRNTGASPVRASYRDGERPWAFKTARGIFSTPVIGGDGAIYIGSADGVFYALRPDGTVRWRFRTGGVIDAAAAIGSYQPSLRTAPITVGSGDERLYHLRTGRHPRRRVIWTFSPTLPPAGGQQVSWWEGNVAIGPSGTIYAGNTGGAAYALNPDGTLRWVGPRGQAVWTTPAFGAGAQAGNTFWGSVDLFAFSLDQSGRERWQTPTFGYVTSSPALGSDGTVYVGSFDGSLYALDPDTGAVRWSYVTDAHIYGSPALATNAQGETSAIFITSADGSVYAIHPSGHLLWRFDTGDPIRSSPVLGDKPRGGGQILYVGSSNGRLYALYAANGRRRWSFDTTPRDPALKDRNDLNGSPALGTHGIYIGGEHGRIWFVPYDYCLHTRDRRCVRRPGQDFGADVNAMFYVTPGGTTVGGGRAATILPSTVISTRLIVRKGGVTQNAALQQPPELEQIVATRPAFRFTAQLSGDGHYLFIRPSEMLRPNRLYRVHISDNWRVGQAAGANSGTVDTTLRFRTNPSRGKLPLGVGRKSVGAFTISRLAIPLPPLLPSVNQIGFDSYEMIAGTLAAPRNQRAGNLLLWVIGGRRDKRGIVRPDPSGNFQFPLSGFHRHDSIDLSSRGLSLLFSFGPVPLQTFDIRGQMNPRRSVLPGTGLYAEANCSSVPNYSLQLHVAGVCNSDDNLPASGTLVTDKYMGRVANRRQRGVNLASLQLSRPTQTEPGSVVAQLSLARGKRYPIDKHLGSILLTDANGSPIPLDYHGQTRNGADPAGNLQTIQLTIPAGTSLPDPVRAYVITDVFPLAVREPR